MSTSTQAAGSAESAPKMTLSQLRHDIRNQLNAIRLSSAVLQRGPNDEATLQTLHDIDRCVERINELVGSWLSDAAARRLLGD
jgi:signal transduction histidine kinase